MVENDYVTESPIFQGHNKQGSSRQYFSFAQPEQLITYSHTYTQTPCFKHSPNLVELTERGCDTCSCGSQPVL